MLVTSVCSLKGGVGKTSVVLGLASAARHRGVPTLVVDLDPQGDATTGLDVVEDPASDVGQVLASPRRRTVEQAVVPSGWHADGEAALDVLVGGPGSAVHDAPDASAKDLGRLRTALGLLEDTYRLVLVDCPPSLGGLTRTGLTASQRALVVTEPGLFSVSAADRALRAVEEVRRTTAPDLRPLGVVLNRVRARNVEHDYRVAEMKELFGPLVLAPQLPERTVLQQAQGAVRPLHEWPAASAGELADAFDALLDRLLRTRVRRSR